MIKNMTLNEATCADGGILVECYKEPGWGQVNLRTVPPGATAGGHRHPRTDEQWVVMRGVLHVKYEPFQGSKPYDIVMEQGHRLNVYAGCGHLVENRGREDAMFVYWRSTLYDPNDRDKEPWEWT